LKDVPISSIFSSPILRARETAKILSESFHQPYQVTEALREYDCGILEDKSDVVSWELHQEIFRDWVLHENFQRKPEGGESFLDIKDRFLPFIADLTRDGFHSKEHILLVGHGGLFQLMLPLVLVNIDKEFVRLYGIGHTECVVAEQSPNGLVCVQWGMSLFV
jgi:probable phosphoglycerate mutase